MKKKFETAQVEIVKLNMADIIATSVEVDINNTCTAVDAAKGADWDED